MGAGVFNTVLFSLTPALSRRERENVEDDYLKFVNDCAISSREWHQLGVERKVLRGFSHVFSSGNLFTSPICALMTLCVLHTFRV